MIKVIYETSDFIVINKPAGMLVHHTRLKVKSPTSAKASAGKQKFPPKADPCPSLPCRQAGGRRAPPAEKVEGETPEDGGTVTDWILKNYSEIGRVGDDPDSRPGIVHRLDRDTSGVLIIAKNQDAFERLKLLFQKGQIKKRYKALVWGELNGKGVIDKPIGLRSGSVKRSVYAKNMKMVKSAVTEYESLGVFSAKGGSLPVPALPAGRRQAGASSGEKNGEKFSLLNVFPKTGRTHQIRVHLQSIHHPVVGDALYGPRKNPFGLSRHFLHAEAVEFLWGKDGERLRIEADLADDLQGVLRELKNFSPK